MQIRIGDKILEVNENRVIKATSKTIKHDDGRIDVEVHVPCLQLQAVQPKGE